MALNSNLIANQPLQEGFHGEELLEGVTLPGKLGDWVRDVRSNWQSAEESDGSPKFVPTLVIKTNETPDPTLRDSLLVSDLMLRGLGDFGEIEPVADESATDQPVFLQLDVSRIQANAQDTLRLALLEKPGNKRHWATNWHRFLEDLGAAGRESADTISKLLQFSFRAQEATEDAFMDLARRNQQVSALVMVFRAYRNALSMDPSKGAESEKLLVAADQLAPSATILALRGLLRTHQVFERTTKDVKACREEALEFARRAVCLQPSNGLVRALASHSLIALGGDQSLGATHALDAVDLNPANPLAWSTLANAHVSEGSVSDAVQTAAKALEISRYSPNRHWWEMNSCVAAVVAGDYEEARKHARMAHYRAPPSNRRFDLWFCWRCKQMTSRNTRAPKKSF